MAGSWFSRRFLDLSHLLQKFAHSQVLARVNVCFMIFPDSILELIQRATETSGMYFVRVRVVYNLIFP